jgi:hypothetical protein
LGYTFQRQAIDNPPDSAQVMDRVFYITLLLFVGSNPL